MASGARVSVAPRLPCVTICESLQVLPFSTGVIMEPLPVGHIADGIPAALADLREDNWAAAAEAIMTTDTVPKAASRRVTHRRPPR